MGLALRVSGTGVVETASMLRSPVTVSMAFVHGMLAGVKAGGQPFDAFLADANIAPELLRQPGARVTSDQYVALFRSLARRLDDDFLGFLSRPLKRGSFALIARSAVGAATLEAAMAQVFETFRLLQDDLVLETVRRGDLVAVALRFHAPGAPRPPFLDELLLRTFWRLLAWMAGGRLPAARFDFAFGMPPYAESYAKVFPAPLRFDCSQSAFWFSAARLDKPVHRDEAALRAFIADAQEHLILPRREDDIVSARVRNHLQDTLPRWPDLAATAGALNMAASTLQRKLAAEGSSFRTLKDELRLDMAIVRLHTSTVALAVLADELGFADSAAFQRAFKTWTGSAPGAYRRADPRG